MNKRMFALVLVLGLGVCAGRARAEAPLTEHSTVDEALDALDARGADLKNFKADVKITETDTATGEDHWNSGTVVLQRKSQDDARIRVEFDKINRGGKAIVSIKHIYTLDDGKLDDRNYDEKKEVIQQVLKPGEKLDLFKLGKGPFPLPLGQKKEDVEKAFDVKRVDLGKDDPPGTLHLQLTPKAESQFARQFKTIDIWIDLSNDMPRRIQTIDPNETTIRTTDLTNVKINGDIGDANFAQPDMPEGSDRVEQPYGQ